MPTTQMPAAWQANKQITAWIAQAAELLQPQHVQYVDGTHTQLDALRAHAVQAGQLIPLDAEAHPGCYLHRSAPDDTARIEDRTFICTPDARDAGPTNNWRDPAEMYEMLHGLFAGSMRGRCMYVIPFCMGHAHSPFARFGIEITDSVYVAVSMCIMAQASPAVTEKIAAAPDFTRCLHCTADLRASERYIAHFPQDNTIYSINSGYGGNALLGKKCMALRIASYRARQEGWLAEHMLIIGIERPGGDITYIAAALPSGCGKTNLAMLLPPQAYRERGWKIWCVGDDIAWLRMGADGRLWALNPEAGFFGIVPGTSNATNPAACIAIGRDTIFTNVAYCPQTRSVWWEGCDTPPPPGLVDWRGNAWDAACGKPAAHPNARFTTPAERCPVLSDEFANPQGVPISAIVFGARRSDTVPLVYQTRDFAHGVFVGSTLAGQTTAAQSGGIGQLRFDSMAMKPFCGCNMGDYFAHWLHMGQRLGSGAPQVFCVNWFGTDDDGAFRWPGFAENIRVLEWIVRRTDGTAAAVAHPIGLLPAAHDINLDGLDIAPQQMAALLHVDRARWLQEASAIAEYYSTFGAALPQELHAQLSRLRRELEDAPA